MANLSRNTVLLLILLSSFFSLGANGQSVLDPNDPVINYDPNNPPTQPAAGQIGKWVRTPRFSWWNTNTYKAYIYNGYAFRLRFPKTYDPTANDGKKYPMMIFFHGYGEIDTITDNENHLKHGGQIFSDAVENGTFDGYVLFMQSDGFFHGGHFQALIDIINYMIVNNKLDPFDIVAHGLSSGGAATWAMTIDHPTYVAASAPLSWAETSYTSPSTIDKIKSIPMWVFHGGLDWNPYPSTVYQVRDAMLAAGANFRTREYPDVAHDTWYRAWSETDFWPFINRAYASNPWPLYGKSEFFPNETISATLALAPGFAAYEWRKDGVLIPGATGNTLSVNQLGTYDARVLRNGIWSEWSRIPVQIKMKTFVTIPAKVEAENYSNHDGVVKEYTFDNGNDFSVAYIDIHDWMDYDIYVPTAGTYPVRFRVTSANTGAQFQLRRSDGTAMTTVDVPNTGGWSNWQTVTSTVFLPAGYHTIRLYSTAMPRFNINWIEFAQASGGTLPVNFLGIDARKENNGARISWRVSDEVNVAAYEVEKSLDGRTFTTIGSVPATRASQYQFTDAQVQPRNYYRVKSIDANGAYKYSSVVSLSGSRSAIVLQVFPQPARDKIVLQHGTSRQNGLITILSLEGRQVLALVPNRNAQQTSIDINALAAGIYLLRYDDGSGNVETLRIVKQ